MEYVAITANDQRQLVGKKIAHIEARHFELNLDIQMVSGVDADLERTFVEEVQQLERNREYLMGVLAALESLSKQSAEPQETDEDEVVE